MKNYMTLITALILTWTASGAVETYNVDPAHSSVAFRVRHFFTPVPGYFRDYEATITVDRDNLENSSVEARISAASIDTDNQKRDDHLRSDEFFEVEKYPEITFKSTSWKKTGENRFDVTGDLTIRGVTRTVTLDTKLLGFGPGMRGAYLSGWEATATIDRNDFGITYGPAVVGDEVTITITVEAVRQ